MRNREFQKVAENSREKLSHTLQKTLKYVEDEQYCRPFRTESQSIASKALNRLEAGGREISRLGKNHTAKEPGAMSSFYLSMNP